MKKTVSAKDALNRIEVSTYDFNDAEDRASYPSSRQLSARKFLDEVIQTSGQKLDLLGLPRPDDLFVDGRKLQPGERPGFSEAKRFERGSSVVARSVEPLSPGAYLAKIYDASRAALRAIDSGVADEIFYTSWRLSDLIAMHNFRIAHLKKAEVGKSAMDGAKSANDRRKASSFASTKGSLAQARAYQLLQEKPSRN